MRIELQESQPPHCTFAEAKAAGHVYWIQYANRQWYPHLICCEFPTDGSTHRYYAVSLDCGNMRPRWWSGADPIPSEWVLATNVTLTLNPGPQ